MKFEFTQNLQLWSHNVEANQRRVEVKRATHYAYFEKGSWVESYLKLWRRKEEATGQEHHLEHKLQPLLKSWQDKLNPIAWWKG